MLAMRCPSRRLAAVAGALAAVFALACGGGAEEDGAPATETAVAGDDGAGMEPRIVVEHPIDAPGRPADDAEAAAPLAAAAWVPHLTVADLEASTDFYRGLGFTVAPAAAGEAAPERVELVRDGARLVLVAGGEETAAETDGEGTAGEEAAAGDEAPAPQPASPVLHLGGESEAASRTVRDPDGHRLALPDRG